MNSNDFTPFATGVGANVLAPATWAADPAKTAGFSAGIASSVKLNTAWRQSTFVSAMIAQFTADFGPGNVVDNGNLPAFEAQFEAALNAYLAGFFQKIILTNTTFFVNNASGSDTLFDGTSATVSGSHGPWATIGHAVAVISTFNLGGNAVTIKLALTGVNYTPPPMSGWGAPSNGKLLIQGDSAAQSSYVIQGSPSSFQGVISCNSGNVVLTGLSVINSSGVALTAGVLGQGCSITMSNVTLGAISGGTLALVEALQGSTITIATGNIFNGSASYALLAENGGSIVQTTNQTVAGGVAFTAFANATVNGTISVSQSGLSWSGSATGAKYSATLNGVINTGGGGAGFYPGSTAGSPAPGVTGPTGGQYA
jgi:hypothetical protein